MSGSVEVYWSFRSPYSYLATPGMIEIRENYDVEVNLRVVLPIAVRKPDFFSPENAKRARYILVDWPRRAEFLGLPHAWPSPDPIVQDLDTFEIAQEQPYIFRLSSLGVEAQRRGKGIDFAAHVSRVLFGGTKDWHLGAHLREASAVVDLDLDEMEDSLEGGNHMSEIEANQIQLEQAGHWGVPTFVFNDEVFFGQDRIDTLCWRLDQHNLRRH